LLDLQATRLQRASYEADARALIEGVTRSIKLARGEAVEPVRPARTAAPTETNRADRRIKFETKIVHGATDGWFLAGNGRSEWFKDLDIGPEWDDATAYAVWLSQQSGQHYRLLTEAEWEYTVRAGTTTPFWWGPSITPTQANYNVNDVYAGGSQKEWRKATVPVGSFAANPWGLYNGHGNVWEWCEDVWHQTYDGAPTDGSPWLQGEQQARRVVRGGSWLFSPQDLRSACRDCNPTDVRDFNLGFRVGRTLAP
jgi:hypothetical protein